MDQSTRLEFQEQTVTKYFADPRAFARELEVYLRCLPMVPSLIDFQEPDWIRMERSGGQPYLDWELTQEQIDSLAATIARFHLGSLEGGRCLCHWDNQPRNILFDGASFHLLDFSDSRRASPEDDLTHLLLFWASEYLPSRMDILSQSFVSSYQNLIPLNSAQWPLSLADSISRFDSRRAQFCSSPPHQSRSTVVKNRKLISDLIS